MERERLERRKMYLGGSRHVSPASRIPKVDSLFNKKTVLKHWLYCKYFLIPLTLFIQKAVSRIATERSDS